MRLWLTRTQPGAQRQAQELAAAGYQVLVEPVLRVEPTGAAVPGAEFEIVVFLSEHAVRICEDFAFCASARLFAIGARTAEALKAQGLDALSPEDERSEGLLAMDQLRSIQGQRVLLVAGEGGRDLLAAALSERGASVSDYRCYRRAVRSGVMLQTDEIDVVVAASGDGAVAAADVWFGQGGSAEVTVLVPSDRVAGIAREAGFRRVVECAGASSRAILSALKELPVA